MVAKIMMALGLIATMAAAARQPTPTTFATVFAAHHARAGLVSIAQLTVTATTATATTITSLGTVTARAAAEPSRLSAMTGVVAR